MKGKFTNICTKMAAMIAATAPMMPINKLKISNKSVSLCGGGHSAIITRIEERGYMTYRIEIDDDDAFLFLP